MINEQLKGSLRIGAGIYDITGPAAEAGMFGYAKSGQYTSGIHMRLRSRAFVFHDTIIGSYFAFVSVDIGCITESVTKEVVERLSKPCNHHLLVKNVILSAMHTHCAPGGLSDFFIYSVHPPMRGFDSQNFECVVHGIVQSIIRAYNNCEEAVIRVAKGDCLGASVNRSLEAYLANPKSERDLYTYDTDKEMILWRMDSVNNYPIGLINWFPVHPTSMGNWYTLITGDNKGYASYLFEKNHGTNHLQDKEKCFVAAFAQSNEGDVSPNIYGPRDRNELKESEKDELDMLFLIGNIQYETAKKLYDNALLTSIPITKGPIYIRHQYIDYGKIELTPKFHKYKDCIPSTCAGCVGVSVLSGAGYDGKGLSFITEGLRWEEKNNKNVMSTSKIAQLHKDNHINNKQNKKLKSFFPSLSNITMMPLLQNQQKEKLVLFPTSNYNFSPSILPLQLIVMGKAGVIIALPFEATTMAGRRLRELIKESQLKYLDEININNTIIAGLSNAYCGYLTTREEYAIQRYEGASTHFGPNQLNATMQQIHYLASCIYNNIKSETLPFPNVPIYGKIGWHLPVLFDGVLITNKFGDIVSNKDVKKNYSIGETVLVEFHGAHPKNSLRIQNTYLEIQRSIENNNNNNNNNNNSKWIIYLDDSNENTFYHWKRWGVDASRITIKWKIADNTPIGIYRIKHIGNYKSLWRKEIKEYFGMSSSFSVYHK